MVSPTHLDMFTNILNVSICVTKFSGNWSSATDPETLPDPLACGEGCKLLPPRNMPSLLVFWPCWSLVITHVSSITAGVQNFTPHNTDFRYNVKLCCIMHLVSRGNCPEYLITPHSLMMPADCAQVFVMSELRTEFSKRAFSHAGLTA